MIVSIDFGGTNIKLGLVNQGVIVDSCNLPSYSEKGMINRLPTVEREIERLLDKHRLSATEDIAGLGIATPGLVDVNTCTILSINDKYADAVGFNFRQWAKETWSLPIVLENDARAALMGEVTYGVARGETDAVLLTFGTGIGTAAIMNGHMVRGKHSQAGILGGHFSTDVRGNACNCGNQGCLEAQAGHWALPFKVRKHPYFVGSSLSQTSAVGYRDVIEAARSGDEVGIDVLEDLLEHWCAGIVNMVHAYDPDTVILSGGLMKAKDIIVPLLQDRVRQRTWTPWGDVKVVVAADPDASVLLGMAALVQE